MTGDNRKSERKPRADAERNRERLLATAKQAFADKGPSVSLDEIARMAGVGIGTLYRHFPTRDALVGQVYLNETGQLAAAAERLSSDHSPVDALREWLRLFVDYLATKAIMTEALASMVGETSEIYAVSGAQVKAAIAGLAARAEKSGDIRLGVEPLDLLRAVVGVAQVSSEPGWEESAKRLVDILIAGMRLPGRQD